MAHVDERHLPKTLDTDLSSQPTSRKVRVSSSPETSKLSAHAEISLFSKIAWWSLVVNLGVVGWGVFLRAKEFGDGCGKTWPFCGGNPNALHGFQATIVEFAHRASTSLTILFAIALLVVGIRQTPRGSQPRMFAYAVMGFVVLEGFVGFLLVRFGLVANNDSSARAVVMSFHVVSTFLLMASIALAGYTGSGERRIHLKGQGAVAWMIVLGFVLLAGLGVSGSISALAHTVDPVKNVIAAASDPHSFWMVRVQPYHPYFALAIAMYLVLVASLVSNLRPAPQVRRAALWMVGLFVVELALGFVNILSNAPVGLQILHLAAADASVVGFALFAGCSLLDSVPQQERISSAHPSSAPVSLRGRVSRFVALTKPRIISLLLVTTLAALFAGARGWPGFWLLLWVSLGGYMMAGAANALNMVVERDLDEAMERTRSRPTVTSSIETPTALGFAIGLAFLAFAVLTVGANLLTACLAFAGLVFYVSVYTLGLKRRTYNNIVIGGAAGAFPPLVGWAASQNALSPLAYYLFAIVFLWTPVHFWALAILIKDDYAAAGVPMLPVVKGVRTTSRQIAVYTMLTVAITLLPLSMHLVGWAYAAPVALLNLYLVILCCRLVQTPEHAQARGLFHYSMIYLALLFVAVAVDQSLAHPASSRQVESAASVRMGVRAEAMDSLTASIDLAVKGQGGLDATAL